MNRRIVQRSEPIVLVGGGPVAAATMHLVQKSAQRAVAADGGAETLLDFGWMPEAVIGDMDSLGPQSRARLPGELIHPVAEQDSTDFEKCLEQISAPLIIAPGFLGGRLDHQLAVFSGLMRFPEQRCVLVSQNDVVFLCPPRLQLDVPLGTAFSLFPLAPVVGRLAGLEWSYERLDFAPGGRIGTSNSVAGPVDISMSEPAMLCLLPGAVAETVITQLAAQPGSWPARA